MKTRIVGVWRNLALMAVVVTLLMTLLVQFGAQVPVMAQEATPTPTDLAWLQYSRARDGIVEKYGVSMSLITNYSFEPKEYGDGIESCIEPENRAGVDGGTFGRRFFINTIDARYEIRFGADGQTMVVCDPIEGGSAPPPAPSDGEAPAAAPADLPAPVSGAANLNGFQLGGHVLEMSADTFGTMNRARMTWIKKQFTYNLGDDPGYLAGFINTAHSGGFRILLGIVGNKEQMGSDGYLDQYAGFVAGAASLGADAIEVWNEPNIDREWPAGQINGAAYTEMLAKAYNAIKSANPSTIVISGAPAPTGFFGAAGCGTGGCNDDVFMQQMAAAGAAQYMDCVGLHYNEGIIPPSQTSGDPRGGYPTYYFSSMLDRGYNPFGGKPVCFTELGYLSGEGYDMPIPANFAWANSTTVAQHAAWLAEAAAIAAQSGRVRIMIVWNVDFPFFTADDPMGGYAIKRPGGICPACDTLSAVMGG